MRIFWLVIAGLMSLVVGAVVLLGLAVAVAAVLGLALPITLAGLAVVAGPLLLVAVLCAVVFFISLVLKMLGAVFSRGPSGMAAEEARVMQEIHRGLSRLEERLDALETRAVDEEARRTRKAPDGGTGDR